MTRQRFSRIARTTVFALALQTVVAIVLHQAILFA